jgi:dolichol-phosphate mannosyltransferase
LNYSLIIPFYNEEESVAAVLGEALRCCPGAEIIAVNDGSTDHTGTEISKFPAVRGLHFPRNLGQSAALYAGLLAARTDICVMMDGDGQNDPADIPGLVSRLGENSVVCGMRAIRRDSWKRRAASRIANAIRRAVLRDGCSDTGCSLKVMWRRDVRLLVPFNGLHRFLPALLSHAGLRVIEVPVNHRPRERGVSKYTVGGRAWRGLRDLLGVRWLLSRRIPWHAHPHESV